MCKVGSAPCVAQRATAVAAGLLRGFDELQGLFRLLVAWGGEYIHGVGELCSCLAGTATAGHLQPVLGYQLG